jgi:GT2 family glycosyltransferase
MTSCSLVIPIHNRASLTQQCLDTLLAAPPVSADVEIVVVDDASTDASSELLAAYGEGIRVVRHARNTGFGVACNDGAAAASGDWLVFLNNDTIPQLGWLDALLAYARPRERLAFVGSKLLFPDDTIQHAGVVFSQRFHPFHIYSGFPASHPAVNKSRQFQAVTAACALIRRDIFQEAGSFDPEFVNGYEDVDLCLRLRRLGYENHYCHESVLHHLESATRGEAIDDRNLRLFLARWGSYAEPDDFRYYLEDGLIEMSYWEHFPALMSVSPELAVLHRGRRNATERLLAQRARQVFEARKENARLRARLLEAGVGADEGGLRQRDDQ